MVTVLRSERTFGFLLKAEGLLLFLNVLGCLVSGWKYIGLSSIGLALALLAYRGAVLMSLQEGDGWAEGWYYLSSILFCARFSYFLAWNIPDNLNSTHVSIPIPAIGLIIVAVFLRLIGASIVALRSLSQRQIALQSGIAMALVVLAVPLQLVLRIGLAFESAFWGCYFELH